MEERPVGIPDLAQTLLAEERSVEVGNGLAVGIKLARIRIVQDRARSEIWAVCPAGTRQRDIVAFGNADGQAGCKCGYAGDLPAARYFICPPIGCMEELFERKVRGVAADEIRLHIEQAESSADVWIVWIYRIFEAGGVSQTF